MQIWLVAAEHTEYCAVDLNPHAFVDWNSAWAYAKECVYQLHERVGPACPDRIEDTIEALLTHRVATFETFGGGGREATVRMFQTELHGRGVDSLLW